MGVMWPVFPHLFLGSSEAAHNLPALHIHSITTLVAIRQPAHDQQQGAPSRSQFKQAFGYETVDIDLSLTGDAFVHEMRRAVNALAVIVEQQEANQGRVLLYDGCSFADLNEQSRQSAALTVMLLYLMTTFNSSFDRAWAHLQSASAGSVSRLRIDEQLVRRCKEFESVLHNPYKRTIDHETDNSNISAELPTHIPNKRILIDTGAASHRKDVS